MGRGRDFDQIGNRVARCEALLVPEVVFHLKSEQVQGIHRDSGNQLERILCMDCSGETDQGTQEQQNELRRAHGVTTNRHRLR